MDNYRTSYTTLDTVGPVDILYPFNPKGIEFIVSSRTGTRKVGKIHASNGAWDGTRQRVHVWHDDGTNKFTDNVDNLVVQVWDIIGGTLTKVLEASVVSYNTTTGYLRLQVNVASSGFQVNLRGMN